MRADAIGACLLVAAGLYGAVAAYSFGLGVLSEPGPGFFPFVASVLIVVCAGAVAFTAIVTIAKQESVASEAVPVTHWRRIALCIAALVAYAVALPWIGFAISTFLLMIGLSRTDPMVTWRAALVIAGLGAAGFWVVFVKLLQVSFPPPAFGF